MDNAVPPIGQRHQSPSENHQHDFSWNRLWSIQQSSFSGCVEDEATIDEIITHFEIATFSKFNNRKDRLKDFGNSDMGYTPKKMEPGKFLLSVLPVFIMSSAAFDQGIPITETLPPVYTTHKQECSSRSSCSVLRARNMYRDFDLHNCFCDELCNAYGDCCEDWDRQNTAHHLDELEKESFSCDNGREFDIGHGDLTKYMYMVSKCPSDWENGLSRALCQRENKSDIFLQWPVSDKRGITFANVYCAQCHGVQLTDVQYYGINIQCERYVNISIFEDSLDNIYKHVNSYECIIQYKVLNNMKKPRLCVPRVIDKCINIEDADLVEKCTNGPNSYVYDWRNTYKNQACAQCTGQKGAVDYTCNKLKRIDSTGPPIEVSPAGHFHSLSLLFDLNGGTRNIVGQVDSRELDDSRKLDQNAKKLESCGEGYIYDPYMSKCRMIGCRRGFHFTNGQCVIDKTNQTSDNTTDCVRHIFNSSEYHMSDNGLVYINATEEWYREDEYHITYDGRIWVCANLTQNYSNVDRDEFVTVFKFDKIQTIISLIGQIISIVCLIAHLIIYTILPSLRNLAGKNLMCLVAALLWAQVFFLVGVGRNSHYGLCVFFAVAIHYGFLAAFCWMQVMSFDIWRAFSKLTRDAFQDRSGNRFKCYLLYGWFAPASVVIAGLVVNFMVPNTSYRPGYGEGLCWITQRLGLIIYFASPVAVVLLSNIIWFSLAAYNIHKLKAATKMTHKNKTDKNRFFFYVKLSVLMGLTWIFGFVAAIADVSPIWYLFVILNSLQGAFICFTFVFTRKIARLLRERICGRPTESQESTSQKKTATSAL